MNLKKSFGSSAALRLVLSISLVFLSGSYALGKKKPSEPGKSNGTHESQINPSTSGDSQLVQAVNNHKNVNFVEGSGMVVTQLLPEDHSGSPHQLWMVKLSNGQSIQAVSNLDMCQKIPLQVGDKVGMGGQFIWTKEKRGLIHWLHRDPKGSRPDGYVTLNGTTYCQHP